MGSIVIVLIAILVTVYMTLPNKTTTIEYKVTPKFNDSSYTAEVIDFNNGELKVKINNKEQVFTIDNSTPIQFGVNTGGTFEFLKFAIGKKVNLLIEDNKITAIHIPD
ncbi:MAG: hypothetical protein ACH0QD_04520 [Tepidibacillus sp.]